MALSNLYGWNDEKETQTAVACGTACGTSDKSTEIPSACGASDK